MMNNNSALQLVQALAARSGIQPAAQSGVQYETLPNAQAAAERLQELQGQGRQGFIQPIGRDGIYGHEVRHWPMQ